MKALSNTFIAGLIAIFLTALVAVLPHFSFFEGWESQSGDLMMKQCYNLHKKFGKAAPDQHLVLAAIDQRSLLMLGGWPFPRTVHGQFLGVLAPEQPKTVGWDIFFTETSSHASTPTTPDSPGAPASTSPAQTTPAPDVPGAIPAASPTPAPAPATPDSTAPPATPSPTPSAPTNSPPDNSSSSPAPSATTSTAVPPGYIGASSSMDSGASPTTSPAPDATASPTQAVESTNTPPAAPVSPTPAAETSAQTTQAPASTNAPPTAPASPAPATTDTTSAAAEPAVTDDEALTAGASLFPHLVTAAESSDEPDPIKLEEMLPTRPLALTNITGDYSKLFTTKSALVPFPELRKVSYFGFANEEGGTGGVRRTVPLILNIGGQVFPSFDFQVLLQYWDVSPDKVIVKLGQEIVLPKADGTQAHIPIDEKGQMTINYRARLEDFQAMSYAQMGVALSDKMNHQESESTKHLPPIKDNIVIVGVTFNGTDAGNTPLDTNAPLVITHLNTLNNILQNDFVRPISPWIWLPIYALFLFIAGNLMLRVGIAPMIPMGMVAMALLAMTSFGALWFCNLQIPLACPEFGVLLLASVIPTKRFFGEEREKQRVKRAMSAYLSEKVMNSVLAHPDNVKLGGVKQVITIMFCDIRGFTAYCDNRDSQEVLTVLNEYMEEMTQVVFKYDGTVDKYIGDCIMAFWNAPGLQPDHAQRAVCCAMEMRYALANFKTKRAGKDTELFECGIGIHTGEALVGNMGSTLKLNYTAMGSTVNLGARLEALTKRLNERILISQDTRDMLEGDFPLTDRGEAMVPGFAKPIHVYAVGADQDISSALKIGRTIATQQDYTAEEVTAPIWQPAPLPEDADPNP